MNRVDTALVAILHDVFEYLMPQARWLRRSPNHCDCFGGENGLQHLYSSFCLNGLPRAQLMIPQIGTLVKLKLATNIW